jgi:hypothetical protein
MEAGNCQHHHDGYTGMTRFYRTNVVIFPRGRHNLKGSVCENESYLRRAVGTEGREGSRDASRRSHASRVLRPHVSWPVVLFQRRERTLATVWARKYSVTPNRRQGEAGRVTVQGEEEIARKNSVLKGYHEGRFTYRNTCVLRERVVLIKVE